MNRKYSEADLQELIRLKDLLSDKKAIRFVDSDCLFASFMGESIFSIYFKEVKVLKKILLILEEDEFPAQHDDDDNELEN